MKYIEKYIDADLLRAEIEKRLQENADKAILFGAAFAGRTAEDNEIVNLIDSLQQKMWKPSEEQVATLKRWLQDHELDGDSRYVYPIFYSLFTDLQKLL